MRRIGIRELKANLSANVGAARAGETIVITDRGAAVARLVPYDAEDALERLILEGIATRPQSPRRKRPEPIDLGTTLSDIAIAERG